MMTNRHIPGTRPNRGAAWSTLLVGLTLALSVSVTANAATLTDLHDFDYTNDGGYAAFRGQLAQGRDGNLYGTMPSGGPIGYGIAFKLTPSGTFTKLHDFDYANDGGSPYGGLTLGKDGNFYGTSYQGGVNGYGTVFKMTPAGAVTTLHSFNYGAGEGINPLAPPRAGTRWELVRYHVCWRRVLRGLDLQDHTRRHLHDAL